MAHGRHVQGCLCSVGVRRGAQEPWAPASPQVSLQAAQTGKMWVPSEIRKMLEEKASKPRSSRRKLMGGREADEEKEEQLLRELRKFNQHLPGSNGQVVASAGIQRVSCFWGPSTDSPMSTGGRRFGRRYREGGNWWGAGGRQWLSAVRRYPMTVRETRQHSELQGGGFRRGFLPWGQSRISNRRPISPVRSSVLSVNGATSCFAQDGPCLCVLERYNGSGSVEMTQEDENNASTPAVTPQPPSHRDCTTGEQGHPGRAKGLVN